MAIVLACVPRQTGDSEFTTTPEELSNVVDRPLT